MNDRLDRHRERLGERFRLVDRLGEGGFGVVYRARDRQREGPVALKVLHEFDPENLYRFKQEFRALADFTHPNLVTLYELGSVEDLWFFTMELVEGSNFVAALTGGFRSDRLRRETTSELGSVRTLKLGSPSVDLDKTGEASPVPETRPVELPDDAEPQVGSSAMRGEVESGRGFPEIDAPRVRALLGDVVRALDALHDAGKLHRDVKPSNVLVDDGRVVVLDFGMVADLMDPDVEIPAEETEERTFVGTPRYAAPEQVFGPEIGAAADFYAVGTMLYEALAGFVPFEGDSAEEILARKRAFQPIDVRKVREDIPEDLAELAMALLARRPERRPGADEILARIGSRPDLQVPARTEPVGSAGEDVEVFVGRDEERREARTAFRRAADLDQSVIIRVTGDSGLGKTALVGRVLEGIRDKHPGVRILRGRCYENESVPYKALDELVDEMTRRLREETADLGDLLERNELAALVQLFPVLGRVEAFAAPEVSPESTLDSDVRAAAVRGFSRLLARLAGDSLPLVLFLDDVQWGDRDSGELFARVMSGPLSPPIVLFVAHRRERSEHSPFLDELEEGLGESAPVDVRRIPLENLPEIQARKLASRLLSESARRPGRVDRIAREAGGNPYFIDELTRFASDRGGESWTIERLDEVIENRVEALTPPERRLLRIVAVAGRPIRRSVARAAAGLSGRGPGAMVALRAKRLIRVETEDGRERLEAYHDRVRETVEAHVDETRRRELHRALARELERVDADAERLSDHYLRAGEREVAAVYSIEAAEQAANSLAYDRAARMLERALECGSWTQDEESALEWHRASILERLARCKEAAAGYLRASRSARGIRVLEARVRSAEQLMSAGHPEPALERLFDVLDLMGETFPNPGAMSMLPRLLWKRIRLGRRGFDYELREVESIPKRQRVLLDALSVIGGVLASMDLGGSAYFQLEYFERALRAGDPAHVPLSMTMFALQEGSMATGRDRPWRMLEEAESLVDRSDQPDRVRVVTGIVRGVLSYSRGAWRESDASFRRVLEHYDPVDSGSMWEFQTLRFYSLMPLFWLGDFERYGKIIPELRNEARDRGNRLLEVAADSWAYLMWLTQDRPDRAIEGLDRAENQWDTEAYQLPDFWQALGRGETLVYRNDGAGGWSLVREHWWGLHRSLLMQVEIIYVLMHHLRGRVGLIAIAEEANPLRRTALKWVVRRSIRCLQGLEQTYTSGIAGMLKGELAHLEGERERAIEEYETARDLLETSDTAFYAAASLRRIGTLRGDERGREFVGEADRILRSRGVESPSRMAAMATARHIDEDAAG